MSEQGQPAALAPLPLRLLAGVLAAWAGFYLMMASHESGHVLAGLVTGGHIDRIDLSPIALSQTHLSRNPHPIIVVWAGPVVGVVDALLAWLIVVWMRRRGSAMPQETAFTFLAGLCLIANGVYLGVGWIDRVGDAGEMMRLGTPVAVLISFGVVSVIAGLWLWHGLGPALGIKQWTRRGTHQLLYFSVAILAIGFVLAALIC